MAVLQCPRFCHSKYVFFTDQLVCLWQSPYLVAYSAISVTGSGVREFDQEFATVRVAAICLFHTVVLAVLKKA